jgi:hypothetical protein
MDLIVAVERKDVSLPHVSIDKVVLVLQTSRGCSLNLEQHINNTIDTAWFKENVSLLMNTFLINGTCYVIFVIKHLIDTGKWQKLCGVVTIRLLFPLRQG